MERILTHPTFRNGITDDNIVLFAVVTPIIFHKPELFETLLDHSQTLTMKRKITLPLKGEVQLTLIWPGGTESGSLAAGAIDLFEDSLRKHEGFMGLPYPQSHTVVLVADLDEESAGTGGSGAVIQIDPPYTQSNSVIAHETAHTYWSFYTPWINEGAAEFMGSISYGITDGALSYSLGPSFGGFSCNKFIAIYDFVEASLDPQIAKRHFICNYALGKAIFVNLYNGVGERAFRQAFSNLYLLLHDEALRDECNGIHNGVCYLEAAFVEGLPQDKAAIAEEIINRHYYGASP